MKKLFLFLIFASGFNAYSQYNWYDLNFEDTSQYFRITFDTLINPNNTWQIGVPDKIVFDSAHSVPNAMVTDLDDPYPPEDTSVFFVTHIASFGFEYPHTAWLSGYYKSDSDSLMDFGYIEFSPDAGETWIDLINDTIYEEHYYWMTAKPALTGLVSEWTYFSVALAELGYVFNIQPGDTLFYRFSFISDSIIESRDGLMYDDLHFEDWAESLQEYDLQFIKSAAYPNPANNILFLEVEIADNLPWQLVIFDNLGRKRLTKANILQNRCSIDLSDLGNGLYTYLVFTETGSKSSGRFIINK